MKPSRRNAESIYLTTPCRLASKPWPRIQMVRVVYSNPMAFARMRRDHDFASVMRSSGVITTYVSLGVDVFQLGLASRVVDSPIHNDPIVMFVACRARITALLESLETTLHGPLSIPYDILRISTYKRVMAWSFDVGKCLSAFFLYISYLGSSLIVHSPGLQNIHTGH